MRGKSKNTVILSVFILIVTMITFHSLSIASKGKVSYTHGNVDWGFNMHGYAISESTVPENHLRNTIRVNFKDDGSSYTRSAEAEQSTYCKVMTGRLNGRKGTHYARYYVDGKNTHNSTQAWQFNN